MFPINDYPYTNMNYQNIDWLITKLREVLSRLDTAEGKIQTLEDAIPIINAELKRLAQEDEKINGKINEINDEIDQFTEETNNHFTTIENLLETIQNDLDNFVCKSSAAASEVFAKDSNANTVGISYSSEIPESKTIVQRRSGGTIVAADAVNDNEVITKGQLDNALSGAGGGGWEIVKEIIAEEDTTIDPITWRKEDEDVANLRLVYYSTNTEEQFCGLTSADEFRINQSSSFISGGEETLTTDVGERDNTLYAYYNGKLEPAWYGTDVPAQFTDSTATDVGVRLDQITQVELNKYNASWSPALFTLDKTDWIELSTTSIQTNLPPDNDTKNYFPFLLNGENIAIPASWTEAEVKERVKFNYLAWSYDVGTYSRVELSGSDFVRWQVPITIHYNEDENATANIYFYQVADDYAAGQDFKFMVCDADYSSAMTVQITGLTQTRISTTCPAWINPATEAAAVNYDGKLYITNVAADGALQFNMTVETTTTRSPQSTICLIDWEVMDGTGAMMNASTSTISGSNFNFTFTPEYKTGYNPLSGSTISFTPGALKAGSKLTLLRQTITH